MKTAEEFLKEKGVNIKTHVNVSEYNVLYEHETAYDLAYLMEQYAKEQAVPLLNACKSVLRLRQLLEYPPDVGYQHEDEAIAVNNMIIEIEKAVDQWKTSQTQK